MSIYCLNCFHSFLLSPIFKYFVHTFTSECICFTVPLWKEPLFIWLTKQRDIKNYVYCSFFSMNYQSQWSEVNCILHYNLFHLPLPFLEFQPKLKNCVLWSCNLLQIVALLSACGFLDNAIGVPCKQSSLWLHKKTQNSTVKWRVILWLRIGISDTFLTMYLPF